MEYTKVVFRVFKDEKDVIALFPETIDDNGACFSYMHEGQHVTAHYREVIRASYPADEFEYKALKDELEGLGYHLKIVRKGYKVCK